MNIWFSLIIIILIGFIIKKYLYFKNPPKPNFIAAILDYDWLKELEERAIADEANQRKHSSFQTNNSISKFKSNNKKMTKKDLGNYGENLVSQYLSQLGSEYFVFNNLKFKSNNWITFNGKKNLRSAQVDHVVVGPTGIFIIETKMWSNKLNSKSKFTPHEQVSRAAVLIRYLLKDYYTFFDKFVIKKVVVSVNGVINSNLNFRVKVVKPGELKRYIWNSKKVYSEKEILKLKKFF